MKKRIGITWDWHTDWEHSFRSPIIPIDYLDAIQELDIIIFPGGEDINPLIYGQKLERFTGRPNVERDKFEIECFAQARKHKKKIFAVCRGHQLINCLLGGSLVQHIVRPHPDWHKVVPVSESILYKHFSLVNSTHHQGVVTVGDGVTVHDAYLGIYEATSYDNDILTVQPHPEYLRTPASRNFFDDVLKFFYGEV